MQIVKLFYMLLFFFLHEEFPSCLFIYFFYIKAKLKKKTTKQKLQRIDYILKHISFWRNSTVKNTFSYFILLSFFFFLILSV